MTIDKQLLLESLLKDLMNLQDRYEEAKNKDEIFEVKKAIRVRMREVQQKIEDLQKETDL